MKNKFSNPFHSSLVQIFLRDWDGAKTNAGDNTNVNFPILNQNPLCQFQRLELDDNLYELYPSGCLIVKDIGDVVSFIERNYIESVRLVFEDQSFWDCSITSVSYLNNASSDTEKSMISINLTNSFYKFSQENSLVSQMNVPYPKLDTIDGFISNYSKNIVDPLFDNSKPSLGICDSTDNYVLYKPLNPDGDKNEVPATDPFQYMLYLSSMAVSPPTFSQFYSNGWKFNPRYFFWTEFGNYMNLKYFGEDPSEEYDYKENVKRKTNESNLRYAVYTGDIPETEMNDKNGDPRIFKKIYFYRNDPTLQYIRKNYYYTRVVPKFLDELAYDNTTHKIRNRGLSAAGVRKESIKDLIYLNLDDGSKYNIEIIGSSGVLNGITSGSSELVYDKHWGYYDEKTNSSQHNITSTLLNSNYGISKKYSEINYMGLTGVMNFVDSPEMWKNMWDFTPIHPDTPYESAGLTKTSDMMLQQVMKVRYEAFKNPSFPTGITNSNNIDFIRKVELQNFLMYNLCCLGNTEEDNSFFAEIIGYEADPVVPFLWHYTWKKLNYYDGWTLGHPAGGYTGPGSNTYSWGGDGKYPYGLISHKTAAPPGMTLPRGSWWGLAQYSFGPEENWATAVNLNELTNFTGVSLGTQTYLNLHPGWSNQDLKPNFKYRPIGVRADDTDFSSGFAHQVVRMNSIDVNKLWAPGITFPAELTGRKLYYFNATNILDGPCD